MSAKLLYIFVEGDDDERFFKYIAAPMLREKYDNVQVLKYAQWKKSKTVSFINSISTLGFDYIFAGDIDMSDGVNSKMRYLQTKFNNLDKKNICIVIAEIESWYLAGLSDAKCKEFHLKIYDDTEELTKEDFNSMYHRKFRSRIDFMKELLKYFSIDTARRKNNSFNYFVSKFVEDSWGGGK